MKQEEPEADRRLGVRDRRRGRRERRSTGIVQPGGEVRKIISTLHHQKHGRQFSVKKLLQRFALILASANQFLRVFSFCSYMWVWKSGRGQTTSSLSWCNWIFNKSTFFFKEENFADWKSWGLRVFLVKSLEDWHVSWFYHQKSSSFLLNLLKLMLYSQTSF